MKVKGAPVGAHLLSRHCFWGTMDQQRLPESSLGRITDFGNRDLSTAVLSQAVTLALGQRLGPAAFYILTYLFPLLVGVSGVLQRNTSANPEDPYPCSWGSTQPPPLSYYKKSPLLYLLTLSLPLPPPKQAQLNRTLPLPA